MCMEIKTYQNVLKVFVLEEINQANLKYKSNPKKIKSIGNHLRPKKGNEVIKGRMIRNIKTLFGQEEDSQASESW